MAPGRRKRLSPPSASTATGVQTTSSTRHSRSTKGHSDVVPIPHVMTLDEANAYYSHLVQDSKRWNVRLHCALWLHQVVGLVVIHMLMYDLNVQPVKLALGAWTALWLGRGFIIDQAVRMVTAVNVSKRIALSRVVVLLVFMGGALSLHSYVYNPLPSSSLVLLAVVIGMDIVSIASRHNRRRPKLIVMMEIVEMAFVIVTFSTQYHQLSGIIIDRIAILFVVATLAAHTTVVHGLQYALFSLPRGEEQQTKRNQRRRLETIDAIGRIVDFEDDSDEKKDVKSSRSTYNDGMTVADIVSFLSTPALFETVSKWLAVQTGTVTLQLVLTAFALHSWEVYSLVMCTSVHLLVEVLWLHSSLSRVHPLPKSVPETVGLDITKAS